MSLKASTYVIKNLGIFEVKTVISLGYLAMSNWRFIMILSDQDLKFTSHLNCNFHTIFISNRT